MAPFAPGPKGDPGLGKGPPSTGSVCVGEPGTGFARVRASITRTLLGDRLATSSIATPPGSLPITCTRKGDATKMHVSTSSLNAAIGPSSVKFELCVAFSYHTVKYRFGGVVSLRIGVSGQPVNTAESATSTHRAAF